jgi:hypothetical protein
MKQNITLRIDKNLIRKAKIIAAQKQTSISRMLSRELGKMVQNAERYEWAKKRAVANLKKGFHLGGKKMVSREELHERP